MNGSLLQPNNLTSQQKAILSISKACESSPRLAESLMSKHAREFDRLPTTPERIPLISLIRRAFGHASSASPWNSREPVREELFSVERLEQHARSLAAAQVVTPKPAKGLPLSRRLANNGAVLLHAYCMTARSIDEGRAITPAAEWLIDNYYLV